MNRQIILASASPRRREILKLLKIKFQVVDSGYEEVVNNKMPHRQMVKFLALGKAKAAAKKYPKAIIIAADTMVSFKGKIIGKPKNKTDAEQMLKSFSGKSQNVMTGVAIIDSVNKKVFISVTESTIYLKKLSHQNITDYVKSGEPFDKAGGYGPLGKGLNLIEKVEGDFTNLLGLPMAIVLNALQKLGVKI